jgi:hypothetical protein
MPPPRDREKQVLIVLGAATLIGLAWLGWLLLGGLGVALLGLLVLFVVIRVELEGDRPVGTQSTPEAYAQHFRTEASQPQADRARRRTEIASVVSTARLFAIAGAILTTSGFALLFSGFGQGSLPELFWVLADISISLFQKGKHW